MEIVKTDLYCYQFIKKHSKFTGCVIDYDGGKSWHLNGKWMTKENWTYAVRLNKLGEF